MTKSKNTKRALLVSVLSMLLCLSMLVGSTFAWFTDSVVSGKNKIVAGNLDVELYAKVGVTYVPVEEETNLFLDGALWEPGHVEVVNLKVANLGTLALTYQLGINVASETPGTNVYDETFKLSDHIMFAVIEGEKAYAAGDEGRKAAITDAEANKPAPLSQMFNKEAILYPAGTADKTSESIVTLVVYMPTTVDNVANYKTGTARPEINLGLNLVATQTPYEQDSFGVDYDKDAAYPTLVASTEELTEAIAEAKDGDVIALTNDMELTADLTIDKNITINGNGKTIENMPVSVGANNTVTFQNVNFANTTGKQDASSVYGRGLKGSMIFDGCTFGDSNWESIQVTPTDNATITIKNCTFTATQDMKRFIHVQPAPRNNYQLDITIENCKFVGCEKVNYDSSEINKKSVIDLDFIADGSTMTLGGCTFINTDGTTATDVHAYFCDPSGAMTYNFVDMYAKLTGTVATYTVE